MLKGTVYVQSEGTEARLDAGDLIRFAPEVSRKLVTRDAPARVLALGATPGKVYTPNPGM